MSQVPKDSAGVLFPPPLIYVIGFVAGYLAHRARPVALVPGGSGRLVGWVVVGLGVLLTVSALLTFVRARTAINPNKATMVIVPHGPYRFTRNPMYLGWVVMYLGAVLIANTPWPLVFLPGVVWVVDRMVIAREEGYLERKFGDVYRAYRARVRRWI